MTKSLLEQFPEPIKVLDHGFVRLVDYMGDDAAIQQAASVSYNNHNDETSDKKTRNLIRYMTKHRHTSPSEQVEIKFHIKMPIMVARQLIRHRMASPNERSGRYTVFDADFYIPDLEQICYQSTENKQGRSGPMDIETASQWRLDLIEASERAYEHYTAAIDRGMSLETARMELPVNYFTEFYWKIDGHNLLHFLSLRMDNHAQFEIRQYANTMAEIVKVWIPFSWEAFVDYRYEAYTISRMEKEVLQALLSDVDETMLRTLLRAKGCAKREINDFLKVMEKIDNAD